MSASKQHIANKVRHYLDDNRQNMVQFLKDMVVIESPSNNKKALETIIKFLSKELNRLGFYNIHVPGKKQVATCIRVQ